MKRPRFFACFCLIAVSLVRVAPLATAQTSQPDYAPGQLAATSNLPATFAFEIWDGLIKMKVNVGDGLPTDAVLATGLPVCFATPAFASTRALQPAGMKEMPFMDRTMKVPTSKPQGLRI